MTQETPESIGEKEIVSQATLSQVFAQVVFWGVIMFMMQISCFPFFSMALCGWFNVDMTIGNIWIFDGLISILFTVALGIGALSDWKKQQSKLPV